MSGVEPQRCPRRNESPIADEYGDGSPTPDHWRTNSDENPGSTGAGMRACSYCGSMHPDDLMKAIVDDGWELGPTDKNYKVYVHERPEPTIDELEQQALDRLARQKSGEAMPPHVPNRHHKFYFQHFNEAQQVRFIGLLNAGTLKIGYPGRFYALPFFIGRKPKEP